MNKKIEKKCAVCKRIIEVNQSGNGQCPHCSWYNNSLGEENENTIIFPNLVSLNKAIRLYKNGNLLRPNLNDFLDCLYSYSEMKFSYKNLMCCVFLRGDTKTKIEFGWSPKSVVYFSDKEDFIKNAKIGTEYVRDIWDNVEDADYI